MSPLAARTIVPATGSSTATPSPVTTSSDAYARYPTPWPPVLSTATG